MYPSPEFNDMITLSRKVTTNNVVGPELHKPALRELVQIICSDFWQFLAYFGHILGNFTGE
jgi:hypothetical protein